MDIKYEKIVPISPFLCNTNGDIGTIFFFFFFFFSYFI